MVLGAMAIIAIVPLSSLFLRRSPEDIGLLPDGNTSQSNAQTTDESEVKSELPETIKSLFKLVSFETVKL